MKKWKKVTPVPPEDASDMEEFTDFFRENFPDYVGIECMVGSSGIWFWDSSLEGAEMY